MAYYPFNGDAKDAVGSVNGSIVGAILAPDRFWNPNSCYNFNGNGNRIEFSNPPIQSTDNWTIAAWINPANFTQEEKIAVQVGFDNAQQGDGYGIGFWRSSEIIGIASGTDVIFGSGTSLSLTGQWYHIVMLRDTDLTKFYINGVKSKNDSVATYKTPTDFTIGSQNGVRWFTGAIDDVRIYNRALSADEVAALYQYESTPQARIATARAQVVNGFVVGATITDAGYGYVSNPLVAIIGGGGNGAKATANQINGVVTSITITNPGSGYTSTPTITIAPPPFPPRKATSTAQVVNGFVVGTKITDGGFGYDTPPAVLLFGGDGSGATAIATVANGIVTAINITSSGNGYTSAPIVRIASPPFAPKLGIEISKVYVRMSVVLGRKYQLEASTDLNTWTTTGTAFIAQDEELVQEFDVNEVGRYFRINQVP